jgi:hypothetical protein
MAAPIELPMAIADCGLDEAQLAAQLNRYRSLGALADRRDRTDMSLTVHFAATPAPELLETAIAVERECCSFFALAYDAGRRELSVSVADPTRRPALDAIAAALGTVTA